MKKQVLAVLLIGCAVAAAGCGNSGKKETEAPKTVETAATRDAGETEAAVVETEAAVVETEAAVVETEAAVVETEAAVVETEAAVVETEAAVVETEAAVVETEAAVVETEAAVVETEAAVVETEEAVVETEEAAVETEAAVVETEEAAVETEEEVVETEEAVETEEEVVETEEDAVETEEEDFYETESEYIVVETEAPMPEYNVSDYLKLTDDDYKNITVEVPAAQQATDEEVDAEIEMAFHYLEDYDDLVEKKTKGKVKVGDTVNIDYVGTKDGEEFDGGSAEGYDLEIGSGTFIDGFEDGLIGKEIGSEVDLDLTFPEEYGVEELNGADVVFHVTLNYVAENPELTDEIAEKLSGGEYDNVEDYVESVRNSIQEGYDEDYRNNAYTQIMGKLAEMYSLDEYPEENVEYYVNNIMEQYIEPYADMYGVSIEDFISMAYNGLTEEEFREQELIPAAESSLTQEIILTAIAEEEGITMTDSELDEKLQEYADSYGVTVEELIGDADREMIRSSELQQKVMEWLFENVNIEEIEETEAAEVFTSETEAEIGAETEAEIGVETEAEIGNSRAGAFAETETETE